MGKEKKRLIESMLLRRRHRCTPNTHPAPNTLQKMYLSSKILKLCIIIIIIIIIIITIIITIIVIIIFSFVSCGKYVFRPILMLHVI